MAQHPAAENERRATGRHTPEELGPDPDFSPNLARVGQTNGASLVGRQLELFRYFHQQLAAYQAYGGLSVDGSEVVEVSFQCLSDGESNEIEEVLGVVIL